jgi:hypothetical protein
MDEKPPEPRKKPPATKPRTKARTAEAASPEAAIPEGANVAGRCRKARSTGPGTGYCLLHPGKPCPTACEDE